VTAQTEESAVQEVSTGATAVATPSATGAAPTAMGFNGVHWTVAGAPVSSAGKRLGAYLLEGVLMLFTLGIGWIIWSLVVWGKGQSPAKALLGMRCVRKDTGRVATFGTMALRELVGKGIIGSVSFGITTLISMFMILGAERSTIWDKISNTVVVDDPQRRLV
jgi:uncharacterized RDD family membrane protein YckC